MTAYRKKLIEVALPLEAINKEAAREKSIRHGHPSTLHLWWARRPLAACRAVLFASLVDDPSAWPERFPTEEEQSAERQRIFAIIEALVKWENSNNERVLNAAKAEIARSLAWARGEEAPSKPDRVQAYLTKHAPPVYDPFCGGGSIPLEAQRLGLEAHASDLNPVAVLITKALIEIPPKFAGRPPVNPESRKKLSSTGSWRGAAGLAEDIRYYGKWMRDEAEKRIGNLYPKVTITAEMTKKRPDLTPLVDKELMVIAWMWARTVASPNPAAKGAHVPLMRSFWLTTKPGKKAWVEPVVDQQTMTYRFDVKTGNDAPRAGTVNRNGATCLLTDSPIPLSYIRDEGKAQRIGVKLIAIVAEGLGRRVYISPTKEHETAANCHEPDGVPDTDLPKEALGFRVQNYGMTKHRLLFTPRQLTALMTLSELVDEARVRVRGATDNIAYADAVATYLSFALSKGANYWSSICTWHQGAEKLVSTFGLPVLPMTWDYTEANPFSDSSGNWMLGVEQAAKVVATVPAAGNGRAFQADAAEPHRPAKPWIVSTDPPYYDNVPYADLSDFFYVWLRKSLGSVYPDLLTTVLVPKARELIAEPFRHGGKTSAQKFFENGLKNVFHQVHLASSADYPFSVFYAFKQQEGDTSSGSSSGVASTGWETMLESIIASGFSVGGTWPIRTEQSGGLREAGRNALASSIVLVCRPRPDNTPSASRREFLTALKRELPSALRHLQKGNIAPVDLAQAAIGPGMAVFSRYSKVLEADGSSMVVRTALALINQSLDEVLAEQEGDFDTDTRWAVAWFDQHGYAEGPYGSAETLCTAKNTSVSGMIEAGIVAARAGRVRLLRREELQADWDPATDRRFTIWEATHYLVRALEERGEQGAAGLIARLGGERAERARDLAYRLYTICERRKWAKDALPYNALVQAWPEASRLAAQASVPGRSEQQPLI